ncbi:MAG TPA: glycosyl transferase family 2 [Erysipelotrichaceae bacterium]|nr:glycosyl transferase family 2 [Erysipelotrichaceae bacterium]
MTEQRTISIIVPIYNVEAYLEKCLKSIFNQTFQSFELILVNDGSTDSSATIAKEMIKNFSNARLIEQANAGLSAARNTGLEHANGKYVAFVDSDDTIDEMMIEKLYNRAIQTDSDIVACDMLYVYDDRREFSSGGDFDSFSIETRPELLGINNSACNKLYKTTLFSDVRFPIGLWYEDLATIPILYFKANRVSKVDEPLYFYYQRSTSIAHSLKPKIFDVYEAIKHVDDYVQTHQKMNLNVLSREIKHMYITHGLHLTTLRIMKSTDIDSVRLRFIMENASKIREYNPKWILSIFDHRLGFKTKIILLLYHIKAYNLIIMALN